MIVRVVPDWLQGLGFLNVADGGKLINRRPNNNVDGQQFRILMDEATSTSCLLLRLCHLRRRCREAGQYFAIVSSLRIRQRHSLEECIFAFDYIGGENEGCVCMQIRRCRNKFFILKIQFFPKYLSNEK